MSASIEAISETQHETECTESSGSFKPSDEVALHRICGWALKSAIDHVHTQTQISKENTTYTRQLELLKAMKLVHCDKHLLPMPVQYLDRGGLTFLKSLFWPWMTSIEESMIEKLNQKSYRLYGSKLFEVN